MEENLNKLLMEEILEATRKLSQERTSIESVLNGQNTVDGSAIEGAEDYQRLLQEKAQYEAEIKKLEGRKEVENGTFVPTRLQTEYEGELNKINEYISKYEQKFQAELADKKEQFDILATEYNQITDAVKVKERIEAEEKEIEPQYTRLLKQKEDCEAELAKLDGRRELRDGTFGPTREQEEYERELVKINSSIAKFATLKDQNRKELEEQEKLVESLYAKYDIRNKAKAKETEQPAKVEENEAEIRKQEAEMWDNYRKEQEQAERAKEGQIEEAFEKKQEQEEIDDLQATYQAQKEADTYFTERDKKEGEQGTPFGTGKPAGIGTKPEQEPAGKPKLDQLLTAVECKVENGKVVYVISYLDENDKEGQFEVADIVPHKMSEQEKENMKRVIDPAYFSSVDIDIADILSRSDIVENTNLYGQYIDFVRDMKDGKDKLENDIQITYNLENLREATDLSWRERLMLRRLARNNQKYGIADYIKPKSRIKQFFERFTQKKLEPAALKQEYLTEEQAMLQTLEDLGKESGFNIIQFIEQQEQAQGKSFSLEEKNKIIQQYGKMTQGEQNNDIRNRVKVNPVDLKSEKATAKPEVQQKENTSKAGREPGDE